ncbi:hypothetical protein J4411_03975 [Candidatus Pacearchaeota archaeon]|nr:hypothetical protein [Candidatus Pacearchaeota archaeon]
MEFEKEKRDLDKLYSEHKNEEEVFMKHVWDEYENKKKNLEKFVEAKFKKLSGIYGNCEVKYDEYFQNFKIKINKYDVFEKINPQEIEKFKLKYSVKEINLF